MNPEFVNNTNGLNKIYINNCYDEKNILENAVACAKDNNGCRVVQKKFEEKKNEFTTKYFEKVN